MDTAQRLCPTLFGPERIMAMGGGPARDPGESQVRYSGLHMTQPPHQQHARRAMATYFKCARESPPYGS